MICVKCGYAVRASAVLNHPRTHKIKITAIENVEDRMQKYILHNAEIVNSFMPEAYGPPVEFLLQKEGFKCVECDYTTPSHDSIATHYLQHHPDIPRPPQHRSHSVTIQSFYTSQNSVYFTINPHLRNIHFDSAYSIFIRDLPPPIPLNIRFPVKKNADLHPMTLKLGWQDHLGHYLDNRTTIKKLVDLCALPSPVDEPSFKYISDHVKRYLETCASAGRKADIQIRKMLYQYPM